MDILNLLSFVSSFVYIKSLIIFGHFSHLDLIFYLGSLSQPLQLGHQWLSIGNNRNKEIATTKSKTSSNKEEESQRPLPAKKKKVKNLFQTDGCHPVSQLETTSCGFKMEKEKWMEAMEHMEMIV